ncbi:glycosyltransferase family 8 protein [Fontimonas sp. SYSU GA230001]|uniref:glycosyltransferase family 8 protein n=1 Tax=Fontimonas sp. SYSU GA230001 TaxID=3142450 RepID=UPI0032B49D47
MIHLACIAEGAYLRHTGAMLHSALSQTLPDRCTVHVLHERPIADDERDRLAGVVAGLRGELRWLQLAEDAARGFPDGGFPRAVWFRVLLPELLPGLERVLYLDSDLIVRQSLVPLWRTDLGGALLGAVTNPLYPFQPPYPQQALGIARPEDYFNSGVLLLDLARMRAEGSARALAQVAATRPGLWYPDQDALNLVCRDRWHRLHPRWNAQSTFFELSDRDLPVPAVEAAEARTDPAIVHFIGPLKPWTYLCRHPLRALYAEHARATPWGVPPLEGRTLRNAVLRQLPMAAIDRWFALERWLARKRRGLQRRLGLAT